MSSLIGVGATCYMGGRSRAPTPWANGAKALGAIWAYDFQAGYLGVNEISPGVDITTFVDTTEVVDANAGDGLNFNGTSSYATAANDNATNEDVCRGGTNWVSIEATIKTGATIDSDTLVSKGPVTATGGNNGGWYFRIDEANKPMFFIGWTNYSSYMIGEALATDTVYHIVCNIHLNSHFGHEIYVNGVAQTCTYPGNGPGGTQSSDAGFPLLFGALERGGESMGHFHAGEMYSAAMYDNTQLTQEQVDAQYALAVL